MGVVGAARAEDAQGVASSRMSYSRFLEYLDMGRVKKVRSIGRLKTSGSATEAQHSLQIIYAIPE